MTGPFFDPADLPAHWSSKRLRFLTSINRKQLPANTPPEKPLRYMDISSVGGDGSLREPQTMLFENAPSRARRLGYQGDTAVSTVRTYLKAIAFISQEHNDCVWSTGFAILSPGPELDPKFLYYVTRSTQFVSEIERRSVGISYPAVNAEDVADILCPVPPLEEQRRIADFLDEETAHIDVLSARKRRLLSLLDEKRAAVGRAAVSGHLTSGQEQRKESDLPWLPTVPSHWRVAKLSFVAKLGTGHTPSRSKAEYWEAKRDIPWLTTSDIGRFRDDRCDVLGETKESISRLGLENSSAELHPAGTVALSRTASVGFSVVMGRDMATSQDFATWTCSENLEPRFLLLCLRAMRTDLQKRLATGSTHKTIYMPDIQSLRIPLPPVDEQRRAVERAREQIEQIDEVSDLIRRQLPRLTELRDALITAAVTSELDPSSYRESAVAA